MDIRFLHSLLIVIDTGSIAAAARAQHLTAAAVSQRIKALEHSLNCQLLCRSGHSAKPTEYCLKLLPRLQRIADEVSQLPADLDNSGLTGELKVGVISTVLSGFLPKRLQWLAAQFPTLSLQIIPGASSHLYQQLLERKIDLAILVQPPFPIAKSLQQQLLCSEPLSLISAKAYSSIAQAISSQPFIQYERTAWGGTIAQQYLTDRQLNVSKLCEIDALESIVLMVKNGLGVSLVPQWQGISDLAEELHVQLIDDPKYQRKICILTQQASAKERLMAAFMQAMYEL